MESADESTAQVVWTFLKVQIQKISKSSLGKESNSYYITVGDILDLFMSIHSVDV